MSGWEYAIVFAVMVLGATIQGSIGFGLNIMVAPIVIQFDASLIPGSLLIAGLVMTLLVALRDRRDVNLRRAGWALVGRFPGVILGVLAVSSVGRWGLSLISGKPKAPTQFPGKTPRGASSSRSSQPVAMQANWWRNSNGKWRSR